MDNYSIALIGEGMIELQEIRSGEIKQTFGGDTFNTAVYLSRLDTGRSLHIDYVTALGFDLFSTKMINFLEKEKIGSSMIQQVKGGQPGLYHIQLDEDGERIFHYWRSEAPIRHCFEYPGSDEILNRLEDYDAVYLSGITLAILLPKSRECLLDRLVELHSKGKTIYCDLNYRSHLWQSKKEARQIYNRLIPLCHTLLLNIEEGSSLIGFETIGEIHQALHNRGVCESVIRAGGNPCSVCSNGSIDEIAAVDVPGIVDTTTAGDSFSAAYLF